MEESIAMIDEDIAHAVRYGTALGRSKSKALSSFIDIVREATIEECAKALDDEEIAEAIDCNKVEKYALHKETLQLAKKAIRALQAGGQHD